MLCAYIWLGIFRNLDRQLCKDWSQGGQGNNQKGNQSVGTRKKKKKLRLCGTNRNTEVKTNKNLKILFKSLKSYQVHTGWTGVICSPGQRNFWIMSNNIIWEPGTKWEWKISKSEGPELLWELRCDLNSIFLSTKA